MHFHPVSFCFLINLFLNKESILINKQQFYANFLILFPYLLPDIEFNFVSVGEYYLIKINNKLSISGNSLNCKQKNKFRNSFHCVGAGFFSNHFSRSVIWKMKEYFIHIYAHRYIHIDIVWNIRKLIIQVYN